MKGYWITLILMLNAMCIQPLFASANPFKKDKQYTFGADIAWYQKGKMLIKTGKVRESSNMLYYHLMLDKSQLKLRLSKNDPSGDILNSRNLKKLTIKDVRVGERRLPAFQWCLDNQERASRSFRQNSLVPDDICINEEGDFIIRLNKKTRDLLKQASRIKFVFEPFSREVTVTFDMQGYAELMAEVYPPKPVVLAPVVIVPVKVKPVKVVKKVKMLKPVAKVAVVKTSVKPLPVKPKKIKTCHIKPPAEYQLFIKSVAYPCGNQLKKIKARSTLAKLIEKEKRNTIKEKDNDRQLLEAKIREDMAKQERQNAWDKKQKGMWMKRCQKYWSKQVSPCFCRKYLDEAPDGVKDTCRK